MAVLILSPQCDLRFANPIAAEVLGYDDLGALHAAWARDLQSALTRLLAGAGMPDGPGHPFRWRPGTAGSVEISGVAYGLGGPTADWLLLAQPAAEDSLVAQWQALTYVVPAWAHDVKAPLNAMMINLELLKETIEALPRGEVQQRGQRYLTALKDLVPRMNRSVEALVSQLRPASESEFDLGHAVTALGGLLAPRAKNQSVRFSLETPDHPVMLAAHCYRVRHAVLLLASTLLRLTPANGLLQVRLQAAGRDAILALHGDRDQPVAIDLRMQRQLTLARHIIESCGGRMQADLTRGATVTVHLPIG